MHTTHVLHLLQCLTGGEYKFPNPGPYCFRINGQVYHYISHLQPTGGECPKFSQIYLYDGSKQVSSQSGIFKDLQPGIISDLQQMVHDINPLCKTVFCCAGVYGDPPNKRC